MVYSVLFIKLDKKKYTSLRKIKQIGCGVCGQQPHPRSGCRSVAVGNFCRVWGGGAFRFFA